MPDATAQMASPGQPVMPATTMTNTPNVAQLISRVLKCAVRPTIARARTSDSKKATPPPNNTAPTART
jgi:hypothetical protein